MSAETAFQDAVLAHLAAHAGVQMALGNPPRLYDIAPRGAIYPFVSVGRGESEPVDADGANLIDHRFSLHIWGRRDDREDVREILGVLRTALHDAELDLGPDHHCTLCRVVYTDLFTGADARTLHGVVRVRGLIGELNLPTLP